MSRIKILTITFAITSVGLAYYLYDSINTTIQETKRIAIMEAAIIDQLKLIREAELGYKAVHGRYTSSWDSLLHFVDSGYFYITERIETVITLDYGADSTSVQIDTLGRIQVIDSLYGSHKYPNFNLAELPYVPGITPKVKFLIWADEIKKANLLVSSVEVWNPSPINPDRDEESEINIKKPLRFGSRTNITTAGNWE
tara:strand:- start:573 stop:1166 length:594 start_codon:yes stop_codon:yes gene_type:complete